MDVIDANSKHTQKHNLNIFKININTFYLFLSVKCVCQELNGLWSFFEQAIGNDQHNELQK